MIAPKVDTLRSVTFSFEQQSENASLVETLKEGQKINIGTK